LMQQFSNACAAFQSEHGFYPGVIPDDILFTDPKISCTENALLHLMGGYRVLTPTDIDPASPTVIDYTNYVATATLSIGTAPNLYQLKVNVKKMGEGPVINGKPYAPYFTPAPDDLVVAAGQVFPSSSADPELPDLIDAWGQPIIYVKQSRNRGPLIKDLTAGTAAPQFALGGVTAYLNSTALGEMQKNQIAAPAGSVLAVGTVPQQNNVFAVLLSAPAFYKKTNPLYGSARGAFALISAGPDGIYFSAVDGPGTQTDPIDSDSEVGTKIIDIGPKVIDEFDDIRVFGGG
jgi:hypothetical protein